MSPDDLQTRRLALGMSIPELAERLDLSPYIVEEWERGDLPITGDWDSRLSSLLVDPSTATLNIAKEPAKR